VLTIEAPYYFIRGNTIFRDHQDPDQFYFLPSNPKLAAENGNLDFTLYKYRFDITDNPGSDPTRAKGAGLALFSTEIPAENLQALQDEVASESGQSNARLTPVIFTTASVHALVAHTDGDHLISDLVEQHPAPIVSPHHAAFALALTAQGATFMEAAVKGGTSPVGVVYEMGFLALSPAVNARVSMKYDRVYDDFSVSLGFTYYYVSAKLDLEIESLVERDLIHIEIISFTDAADEERQRQMVMNLISARIKQDFFHSGLPPQQDNSAPAGPLGQLLGSSAGNSKVSSASALFVLKARYDLQTELKQFNLVYDGRTAIELTHTSSGFLSTIVKDGPSPNILEIDLHDPFFSTLEVQLHSVIDFNTLTELKAATLNISFGDHRTSYIFSPATAGPFRFAAALAEPDQDQYQYDINYDFDTGASSGPAQLSAGPFQSRSRALVVDPMIHFRYRRIAFLLGPLDLAQVPQIHVHVRASPGAGKDDLASEEIVLNASNTRQIWRVHLPLTASDFTVLARTDWEDAHGVVHAGDESEVTSESVVALGPYRDLLSIQILPATDWTAVSQVVVEIRYQDGDDLIDKQFIFIAAQKGAPQHLDIPLLDPAKRQYRWQETIMLLDGTSETHDWTTVDSALLVVGKRKKTTADLQIVWVGQPGDIFGLRVDIWATDATGNEQKISVFLRAPGETQKSATLPLGADGQLDYRFEIYRVSADGDHLVRSGDNQHSSLLVAQAGAN
jgi:hypothetical protein